MKKKLFILLASSLALALFTLPVFSQQHHMMMGGQQHMMDMHQMGAMMDSTMNWSKMMRMHMKDMDVHHMMGGEMGMNSMMGMSMNLESMAQQMKNMTQHMEKMMNSKEMTADKDFQDQMNKMHEMMSGTSENLQKMTKMMSTMKDEVYKEKEEE